MYLSPLMSAAHKQSNWRAVKNSLLQWNWCRKSPSQNSWGLCHPSSTGNPDRLCKHVAVVKYNIYHISACILKYIIQSFVYVWLMMRLSWKLVDGHFSLLIPSTNLWPLGLWHVSTPKFRKWSTLQEDCGFTTSCQESNVNTKPGI